MNLLIVDDEIGVRQSIAYVASLDGWKTFTQDQHEDCHRTVLDENIDLLITDYHMSPITGLDLIEELRDAGIQIPVIIISGDTVAIDGSRAERLGVYTILGKPPDVQELRKVLSDAFTSMQHAPSFYSK